MFDVQAVMSLVMEHDLVPFLAKVLLSDESRDMSGELEDHPKPPNAKLWRLTVGLEYSFMGVIAQRCQTRSGCATRVLTDWEHSLTALTAIERAQRYEDSIYSTALEDWREFGLLKASWVEIDERPTDPPVSSQPHPGCNWVRCPLHLSNHPVREREMLRCSGCRTVRSRRLVLALESPTQTRSLRSSTAGLDVNARKICASVISI